MSPAQRVATPEKNIDIGFSGIDYKDLTLYTEFRIVVRQILDKKRLCTAIIHQNALTSQSIYNIVLPAYFHPVIDKLHSHLQSDLISFYNYQNFSQGKRLFTRILLGVLKALPWIPKGFAEIYPHYPEPIPILPKLAKNDQELVERTLL